MNSAIAVLIGLLLSIVLIIRKVSPVYSLMLGALAGGLLSGLGLEGTVAGMVSGVKDITPAILRILAAGVLSGVLIKTGAAASISRTISMKLGRRHIYLSLAVSAMLLTAAGVFVDVAVITVAPVALMMERTLSAPKSRLLLAMIGGAKCGNIISPNPNTIIAAENFGAPLPDVMAANIIPALVGLAVTVYVIVPLMPSGKGPVSETVQQIQDEDNGNAALPSFWASLAGPVAAIALLALRPLTGFVVDPVVALPAGGLIGIAATGSWKKLGDSISFGLDKMSVVAVLLIGTGTLAGIIALSDIKDLMIAMLSSWELGSVLMAPVASILMCAATASTTAGATIASASFAPAVLDAGVPAVAAAAMTNAGATVLDHLPHGSFFHTTGGSMGMSIRDRLKIIPFESAVGLVLVLSSFAITLI